MKTKFFTPTRNHAAVSLPAVVALFGVAAFVGGCASEPDSRVVSAPPPAAPATVTSAPAAVVTTPSSTTPGQSTIVVTQQPPTTTQAENPGERPSPDHVWVAGYWKWNNDHYEWVSGHWVVPPHAGAVWNPPRWVAEGNGYRFYDGYWD